jgi:hypothetical protein
MDERQKEGFRELEKSGYLKQVREFAMARCVPFFWSTQESGQPPRLLHNGTICYVDTGQRKIGITNDHVYQQYLEDLANFPDVEAQFDGNTIKPETRLIDRNKDLDLATFDVPAIFVSSSTRNLVHHMPAGWPPSHAISGDLVLYGGYPGELKEISPGPAEFPFQSFIWRPTDITDTNIVLHVDFPNLFWPGHEEEGINQELGGISGGPVFRVIEQLDRPEKRVYYELVGIVYEIHESWEVVRARHIRHVLADGTLVPL